MRSESKMKLIETTIVVEPGDMMKLARESGFWPKDGTIVESWIDEESQCFKIRVQVPDEGEEI